MPDLAEPIDVEQVLGRSLTSDEENRVGMVLRKASELFRREAQQKFTAGESVVRLRNRTGTVYLPERPVIEVASVVDDDGETVEHTVAGQVMTVTDTTALWFVVSYTHGGVVPDLVRDTVAEVAARALLTTTDAWAGKTQAGETVGPFSTQASFAAWVVGGGVRLSPEDMRVARSFRNPWRAVVSLGS